MGLTQHNRPGGRYHGTPRARMFSQSRKESCVAKGATWPLSPTTVMANAAMIPAMKTPLMMLELASPGDGAKSLKPGETQGAAQDLREMPTTKECFKDTETTTLSLCLGKI